MRTAAALDAPSGLDAAAFLEWLTARCEVVDSERADPCWVWGGHTVNGYPRSMVPVSLLGARSKTFRLHRLAYAVFKGSVPQGFLIDHLCRNRACCNPEHLELVSDSENQLRGWAAYRRPLGAHRGDSARCKRGHERTTENRAPRGQCLICKRTRDRARKLALKAARSSPA